jgi:hypothetical protein
MMVMRLLMFHLLILSYVDFFVAALVVVVSRYCSCWRCKISVKIGFVVVVVAAAAVVVTMIVMMEKKKKLSTVVSLSNIHEQNH